MIVCRIRLFGLIPQLTVTAISIACVAIWGGFSLRTASAHAAGENLSGFGTAKLECVISPDEPYFCTGGE